jgi:hypothetical protein
MGFEKVGETRIGEGGRVIKPEVVHTYIGLFKEIIDGWFEQDEGRLVSHCLAHIFVCRELVVQIMLPVGNIEVT